MTTEQVEILDHRTKTSINARISGKVPEQPKSTRSYASVYSRDQDLKRRDSISQFKQAFAMK
jgi:hypothetical protein